MDDVIYRQDAINEFSYCQTYLFDSIDRDPKISLEDAKYAIEQLPSAQQWIPCSERLPDSQEDVLCDEDGHVILGFYTDEEIGWHDTHSYRIYPTAWMPLPSPYREEVSD